MIFFIKLTEVRAKMGDVGNDNKLAKEKQFQEDDLAFAKGCFMGALMATPIWFLVIILIKWLITKEST